ncbi:phage tail protein I [Thiotrichales bacterium 19S11-10]|nr:phage tail protein I [Thiotrichales bacterium 19S11-10]
MKELSMLPPNATDFERAIVSAFFNQLELSKNIIFDLFDANSCPVDFLPYLAYFMSVDYESFFQLDENKQRQLINESIERHQKKGTLGALEEALEVFNQPIVIKEWYQEMEETNMQPHTFKLEVNVEDKVDIKQLRKLTKEYKNLPSAYKVNLLNQSDLMSYFGVISCFKHKTTLQGS